MIRVAALVAGIVTLLMGSVLVVFGVGMAPEPAPGGAAGPHPADGVALIHVAPVTISVLQSARGSPTDRVVEISFWLQVPADQADAARTGIPRLRDAWNRDLYRYLNHWLSRNRAIDLAGLRARLLRTARATIGDRAQAILLQAVLAR